MSAVDTIIGSTIISDAPTAHPALADGRAWRVVARPRRAADAEQSSASVRFAMDYRGWHTHLAGATARSNGGQDLPAR